MFQLFLLKDNDTQSQWAYLSPKFWFLSTTLQYGQYLVLWCSTDVVFFTNGRQDSLPMKKIMTHFCSPCFIGWYGTEAAASLRHACLRHQGSSEKWAVPGLLQGNYELSLGHCLEPQNKDVLRKDGILVERMGNQRNLKGLPRAKAGAVWARK